MTDPMPRKDVELPPRMPEAAIIAELRAELAQARADQAREMRPKTTSEHIARDMRECRFPEQSERQMVPVLASLPDEIQVWRSTDTLDHIGTWATTRFPAEAVTYVPKADAQAAVALALEQAAKIATRHWEGEPEDTLAMEAEIRALAHADGLAAVEALRERAEKAEQERDKWFEGAGAHHVASMQQAQRADIAEAELAAIRKGETL